MTESGLVVGFIFSVIFGFVIGVLLGLALFVIWNNPNKRDVDGWE